MATSLTVRTLPLPTRLPAGPVNAYLLVGDPLTLVDPGPDCPEARDALLSGMAANGVSLREVRQVIVTHAHEDHAGLARWVAGESGARVLTHPITAGVLASPRLHTMRTTWLYLRLGQLHGVPEEVLASMYATMAQTTTAFAESCPVHHLLPDGSTVAAGGGAWRVLFTPGHAAGHICLLGEDGTLLGGDLLLADGPPAPLLEAEGGRRRKRPRPLLTLIRSLQRVSRLPIRVLRPGHGRSVQDAAGLCSHHLRQVFNWAVRARELLREEELTVYGLSRRLFPSAGPANLRFSFAFALGLVDLLSARNRVEAVRERGRCRFRSVRDAPNRIMAD